MPDVVGTIAQPVASRYFSGEAASINPALHMPQNVASDMCDLFHPSFSSVTQVRPTPGTPTNIPEAASWTRPHLYLAVDGKSLELLLLLPLHAQKGSWTGSIVFKDSRGTQRFGNEAFARRTAIHILPRRDPYVFLRDGIVNENAWASIREGVDGLTERTVFHRSEMGGRRLEVNEPMEMGTKYRLLVPATQALNETVQRIAHEIGTLHTWTVYDIKLPDSGTIANWGTVRREYLEDWFGHPFRSPSPQVWIVTPFPCYSENDVWVFPPAPVFELRVSGLAFEAPVIRREGGELHEGIEKAQTPERWLVRDLVPGFYSIRLRNRIAMQLRVLESSPHLFTPEPIRLRLNEQKDLSLSQAEHVLAEMRLAKSLVQSAAMILTEHLSSEVLSVNGTPWFGEDLAPLVNDLSREFTIDADSYGRILLPPLAVPTSDTSAALSMDSLAMWLLALPPPKAGAKQVHFPPPKRSLPQHLFKLYSRTWAVGFLPQLNVLWNGLHQGESA